MFTKVDEQEIRAAGVTPLPDSPTLQPAALKAKFDEKGDMALSAFNNHIDEITAESAAANIGAVIPEGITAIATVQSALNGIALLLVACDELKHWHDNKVVLDSITSAAISSYDALVTMLSGITGIEETLSPLDNTKIPTSKAIATYVTGRDSTIQSAVHPVGCLVLCEDGTSAGSLYGGTWSKVGTVGDYDVYKRTA